jgi:SET domain-containing protein
MSKRRAIVVDISNGEEKTTVTCPSKHLVRLDSRFKYEERYRSTSFLEKGSLDDYLLPSDYSCSCEEGQCTSSCSCITSHIGVYECNKNCSCVDESCSNRVVQNGIERKLEVFFIDKSKGFGVRALEPIKKNEFVCEYIGEIIHKEKAFERINRNLIKRSPNYVLQVRENYEKIIISTFIDAEEYGNVSRFLNHSCEPNLYFDIVRIQHFIPHVAFFALRDIKPLEELTFSYCDIENIKADDTFSLSYKECLCGAEKCIKYLPN